MSIDAARRATELVARGAYGRLVAILSARSRDIAAAEDALAEAMVSALTTWPDRGVPANPEAWLITAARNRMKNDARHDGVGFAALSNLLALYESSADQTASLPDERLKLLFVCAHPAIDPAVRTPLMMQTILGLDAARIAQAFLVAPATMGQRLVRAKAKIKLAGLRFEEPSQDDMPARLTDVLEAIYAAFGVGWEGTYGAEGPERGLADEAIYLCRLLVTLLPREPEAKGLLALMLYCEARRPARRSAAGSFVPLDRQDARLWSREMIIEAENLLTSTSRFMQMGRFQCEAAIQSVHVQTPITGRKNLQALLTLYQLLADIAPSTGVLVGLAAVLVDSGRCDEALSILDDQLGDSAATYQPFWVTRARTLNAIGRKDAATKSLQTAIELTEEQAVREYLHGMMASGAF